MNTRRPNLPRVDDGRTPIVGRPLAGVLSPHHPLPITTNPDQFHGSRYCGMRIMARLASRNARAAVRRRADGGTRARRRWNSIISFAVLAEPTFHWLTTEVGQPATRRAQDIPTRPSPPRTSPRPVSQLGRRARGAGGARDIPARPSPPRPARRRVSRRDGTTGWGGGLGFLIPPPPSSSCRAAR